MKKKNNCFAYGTSVQGSSHIKTETECQDYCSFKSFCSAGKKWYTVAGVADGVGSCSFSAIGSKVAIENSFAYIESKLADDKANAWESEKIKALMLEAFQSAYNAIISTADEKGFSPLSLATTLTVALYDGDNVCIGHIGDSGIVVLYRDGTYDFVTRRDKGETASSVIPLLSPEELWSFGLLDKPVAAVFLMTDGILDTYVASSFYDNAVYWPFFAGLMVNCNTKESSEELSKSFAKFLSSTEIAATITDDISVVVVQNIAKKAPKVKFSEQEYIESIQKKRNESHAALYKQFEEYQSKATDGAAEAPEDTSQGENKPNVDPEQDAVSGDSAVAAAADVEDASKPADDANDHSNDKSNDSTE